MSNKILHLLGVLEVLEVGPERVLKTNQILLNIMKMINSCQDTVFPKKVLCV